MCVCVCRVQCVVCVERERERERDVCNMVYGLRRRLPRTHERGEKQRKRCACMGVSHNKSCGIVTVGSRRFHARSAEREREREREADKEQQRSRERERERCVCGG